MWSFLDAEKLKHLLLQVSWSNKNVLHICKELRNMTEDDEINYNTFKKLSTVYA